mmetsp:Transcript_9786/g.36523  ORF Transcript_9786/g.36523 Transcript_9786/m.36523 type:complete len:215 (+) Transcript_9786:317-961(+)
MQKPCWSASVRENGEQKLKSMKNCSRHEEQPKRQFHASPNINNREKNMFSMRNTNLFHHRNQDLLALHTQGVPPAVPPHKLLQWRIRHSECQNLYNPQSCAPSHPPTTHPLHTKHRKVHHAKQRNGQNRPLMARWSTHHHNWRIPQRRTMFRTFWMSLHMRKRFMKTTRMNTQEMQKTARKQEQQMRSTFQLKSTLKRRKTWTRQMLMMCSMIF